MTVTVISTNVELRNILVMMVDDLFKSHEKKKWTENLLYTMKTEKQYGQQVFIVKENSTVEGPKVQCFNLEKEKVAESSNIEEVVVHGRTY